MKISVTIIVIVFFYFSFSNGYINYISYDSNCQKSTNGVSFGLNEFHCMVNGTADLSSSTLFTFQIYGENQVNLTTHSTLYCDNPVYSKMFTLDECSNYEYSNSNYYVTQTDSIPNIPTSSFLIKEYDSNCEMVESYWYATNGTVTQNHKNGITTTYMCINGLPIQIICQGDSCKQFNLSISCESPNYTSIECSN